MQEHPNLSDIEKATLDKTIVDICHLYIGDQIEYTEDKEKIVEIHQQREKLWLDTTVNAGNFESRAYWIHKELNIAYKFFNYGLNRYHAPDVRQLQYGLFVPHMKDRLAATFLSHLTVAYSERNNSKDYAGKAREILRLLGLEYGLIDQKLEQIGIYEVVELVLTAPTVWDDGEIKKK